MSTRRASARRARAQLQRASIAGTRLVASAHRHRATVRGSARSRRDGDRSARGRGASTTLHLERTASLRATRAADDAHSAASTSASAAGRRSTARLTPARQPAAKEDDGPSTPPGDRTGPPPRKSMAEKAALLAKARSEMGGSRGRSISRRGRGGEEKEPPKEEEAPKKATAAPSASAAAPRAGRGAAAKAGPERPRSKSVLKERAAAMQAASEEAASHAKHHATQGFGIVSALGACAIFFRAGCLVFGGGPVVVPLLLTSGVLVPG